MIMDAGVQINEKKKEKTKKGIKLSNSTIAILLFLLSVVVLGLSVGYIRPTLVDKNTELQAINDDLAAQLAQVQELEANQASYEEQSAAFDAETNEILARFPAMIKEEDTILYARELEDTYDRRVNINLMGISPANLIYATGTTVAEDGTVSTDTTAATTEESTESTDTAAADADVTTVTDSGAGASGIDLGILEESDVVLPSYMLYSVPVSCDFSSNYTDLKAMIEQILSDPDARNISTMSLSYDGGDEWIVGTIAMNIFYLDGTGKTYEEPDTGVTVRGKDNVYETIESPDYDSIKIKSDTDSTTNDDRKKEDETDSEE
jgi:hypothetical protein